MTTWKIIVMGFLFSAAIMALLHRRAVRDRDAGWVDVDWSGGMGLVALFYAAGLDGWWPRKILLGLMVGIWSFRLASFIYRDRVRAEEEDGRYQALRKHWGDRANARFFWFFQAQAVLVTLFSLPVLVDMLQSPPIWTGGDLLGLTVWLVAVAGEALADRQLSRFRSDPGNKGKVCRRGLWSVSRHPNYFFEWLHWWSYVAMGLFFPWGWVTLLGPGLMFLFLFKVTGIPYTERRALVTRGDAYRDYQATTSIFVPWFHKKSRGASHEPATEMG